MEVERLTTVLEVGGFGPFMSQLAAADKANNTLKLSMGSVSTASKETAVATTALGNASGAAAVQHQRHAKELNGLEREARGGIASFTGLGRAMFFASNAFLGGALVGGALKGMVDATRNAQDATDQLRNAAKNAGIAWDTSGAAIESYVSKASAASEFRKTDLTQAMTHFVLATGSVTKAEEETTLATDLARAAHEDLATATTQVAQAELGRLTTLRGLGIAIQPVKTAEDNLKQTLAAAKTAGEQATVASLQHAQALAKQSDQAATAAKFLALLREKTQGADAAFSGSAAGGLARFHKSLNDLEVSVGTTLLPTISNAVAALSRWMDHLQQTGQAQRDAKEAADALKTAFDDAKEAIDAIDKVTGSFKNTLLLIVDIKAALWFGGLASKFTELLGVAGASGILGAETGLKGLATALTTTLPAAVVAFMANPEVAGFIAALGGLAMLENLGGGGTNTGGMPAKIGSHSLSTGAAGVGYYVGKNVVDFDPKTGKWYVADAATNANGRYVTPSQAAALLGVSTAQLPGTGSDTSMRGAYANHGRGGALYGASLAGENPMIPQALQALAGSGYQVDVTSGYRTYAQQAALYARYVKSGFNQKFIAAKPGTSNHETGNAVDVYVNGAPVDQSAGALAILKKYGLVADVKGDHEHLDLLGYGGSSGSGSSGASNLGLQFTAKHKKASLIPQDLQDAVSTYRNLAANLSNTGPQAKKYLEDELGALRSEQAKLDGMKQTDAVKRALTSVENNIRDVQRKIKDAIVVTGDALLNSGLKSKLASLTAQAKADADYAAVLTGTAADQYRKITKADLTAQAGVLEIMVDDLQSKLKTASGKQKAAIQTELDKLKNQLDSVQQGVVQNLQDTVKAAQQNLSTVFASVQSELDTQLGNLYFQNGLKTASEAALASMQAADQVQSLNDALQAAKDTLAADQSGLAKTVLDVSTGQVTNVYDPLNAKKIAQDNQAVNAAQRQIDEYNLSIKATQERTTADTTYATQVASLNKQLAAWEQSVENGTGSMDGLKAITDAFGITIDQKTVPDLTGPGGLTDAVKGVKDALADLAAYIATITGKTPAPPPTTTTISQAQADAQDALTKIGVPDPAGLAKLLVSPPVLDEIIQKAIVGKAIPMAGGGAGRVTKPTLFFSQGHEDYAFSGEGRRFSGGGDTFDLGGLHVHALDPETVDWDAVAHKAVDAFHLALVRKRKRTGDLQLN